jgi:hypothetical protein
MVFYLKIRITAAKELISSHNDVNEKIDQIERKCNEAIHCNRYAQLQVDSELRKYPRKIKSS